MLQSRTAKVRHARGGRGPTGLWSQSRHSRWVHMLYTPRRGYVHHGIYVGDGKVVHYAGLAHGLRRGPVEEISLARFANGYPVCVRSDASLEFEHWEIIRRARSRVGEDHYRLLTNNCEHFCEWCLYGVHRSYQVEEWLVHPARALHAAICTAALSARTRGRVYTKNVAAGPCLATARRRLRAPAGAVDDIDLQLLEFGDALIDAFVPYPDIGCQSFVSTGNRSGQGGQLCRDFL